MIQAVFIIAESGLCLLSRPYGQAVEGGIDDNLIGGFLQAVGSFGEELRGGGMLEDMTFRGFKIVLSRHEGFMVAGMIDQTDDRISAKAVLGDVGEAFLSTYRDKIIDFDGSLDHFTGFEKLIDDITKDGTAAEQRVIVPLLKGKVSPMLVRLGQMTQVVYDVAKMCVGKLTVNDIAYELKMPMKEVTKAIHSLEDMDMLEWKEIG
ncbi:MAG: hypothetical protein EAX95_09465 [Candidatus Thorarchaeota archaeon]|nr:hypothetical protein [Candidatus Thorarchaeota archaeon]